MTPSPTSTSVTFNYYTSHSYFVKTIGYYYLLISSKYSSFPYFSATNQKPDLNNNLTAGSPLNLTANFVSTFNTTGGPIVGVVSITGLAMNLFPASNYFFGFTIKFTNISGGQANVVI